MVDSMTRDEMIGFGCGVFCETRTEEWKKKQDLLYKPEGVWQYFLERREHYRLILGGNAEAANKAAQAEIDAVLFKRAVGFSMIPPQICHEISNLCLQL